MAKSDNIKPTELQIHIPNELRAGVYANITNVNVSPKEVTINFVYVNAHDTPKGTLVSRIIVSREHAMEISELLKNIVSTANEVDPK